MQYSKKRSPRMHPKHGPNATIAQCFLCGKDKNELVLLGNSYKEQAPMHMCLDKEPCDECKGFMGMGVLLICVKDGTDKDNPYRTGAMCVLKEEAARRLFPTIGDARASFVEDKVWDMIGLPKENIKEKK